MKKRNFNDNNTRQKRKTKSKIIIAVEGKNKTEKTYFSNLDNGKKDYSISFAKGNYTDPINLVKMLIIEMNKLDINLISGDKAYCVFDTDININKNNIISEAKRLANENNIEIITSTPSVEIWFLLHYEYTTAPLDNKDLILKIRKYLPKYEKNTNIYNEINDKINLAISRAKKLENYHINNGRQIGTVEANPNTEIYKIIENLNI